MSGKEKFELSEDILNEIINNLPVTIAVLDNNREIVMANEVMLDNGGLIKFDDFIGLRPGEAFNCLHFIEGQGACGENDVCKFCGTANVIMKAQKTGKPETSDSKITRIINGIKKSQEFKVSVKPITINSKNLFLLTLLDISAEKRKRALERIFFHDILNKIGTINGFLQLINSSDDDGDKEELISITENITNEMADEIVGQKELMAAEEGELQIGIEKIIVTDIVNSVYQSMSSWESHKNKQVQNKPGTPSVIIETDHLLLKRVLVNMGKNALEASKPGQIVTIGCEKLEKKNEVRFWVHNHTYMPEYVQLQIFHRSFSTKGNDRGLGTYSIKLLGEGYLKGKVGFQSIQESGTTFWIDLPISSS